MNTNLLAPLIAAALAAGLLSGCATAPSQKINIDYAYFYRHPLTPLDNALRKPLEEYFKDISLGEKMIAAKPNDGKGYSIVGTANQYIWSYYSHDKAHLEKSIAMLQKSIEVDPKDPFTYIGLSIIYCKLGKHNDELLELDKALGIEPSDIGFHLWRAGCLRELGRENEALLEDETIKGLRKEE